MLLWCLQCFSCTLFLFSTNEYEQGKVIGLSRIQRMDLQGVFSFSTMNWLISLVECKIKLIFISRNWNDCLQFVRAVGLLALELEKLKSRLKLVTNKKSTEIMMSAAEKIHLQLLIVLSAFEQICCVCVCKILKCKA